MQLSVIIVNYNVKYFLEQCLVSVYKALEGIDGEVFVVDNDSVDGSMDMVRARFPRTICVDNKENVGFSKANNQAIRESRGKYVLLLNPDTVVQEDTFSKCISYMDLHEKVGGLGVKMIDGKGNFLPESKRGLPTPEVAFYKMVGLNKVFPRSKRFGKYHMGYIGEDETAEVDVLAGAYMLMRKSVLDEIGLLDETFFMYGEDIDLSYRITQAGYQNVYFPETSIIHYKGESTKRMSANYVFIFYRAMVIFAKKHYSGKTARLFTALINASIYVRASLALVQRFVLRSWVAVVDFLLVSGGLVLIKDYWEEHIKNFEGYFAPVYAQTHFPAYAIIWILMVFWSGGYQKPYSIQKILRGVLAGTVFISAVFAFLPDTLRYSRGIILAGTASTALLLSLFRLILHVSQFKNLRLGRVGQVKTAIVGKPGERERVRDLLEKAGADIDFRGFISVDDVVSSDVLGSVNRLDEVCSIYGIDEVIFCGKDISSSETMQWMSKMATANTTFKIVPEAGGFIIGSNSKNLSGELYTEEVSFAIADANTLQKKRLLDILVCLLKLLIGPLLCWFTGSPARYFKSIFSVLSGKSSWVGYNESVETSGLPEIKPGIYQCTDGNTPYQLDTHVVERLNFFYAKNYEVAEDVNIILKRITH